MDTEKKDDYEKSAEEFVRSTEVEESQDSNQPNSLGKAETFNRKEDKPETESMGYVRVPIESLPSRGLFYPDGTTIAIRAASVQEIRHWSTIDENDYSGMDDVLNFVMERCTQTKMPGSVSSWKDIKEIDRFYLIFAIREFTFKNGENKLYVPTDDGDKVEVRKEMIKYFDMDEELERFYDPVEKCIKLETKSGEVVKCYLPSIGITQFIKRYVQNKQQSQQPFDKAFLKFAPFLFNEWRALNQTTYEKEVQESSFWSINKISAVSKVADLLAGGVDPKLKYTTPGGAELETPLNFQGGIKSIFLISDIFDELV